MNYRIDFAASASAQIPGLPDPEHPLFREQMFGTAGLVSYVVNDAAKVVHVYSIVWAG